MRRRLNSRHKRLVGVVSESHYVLMFVVLPVHEGLVNRFYIELRVVRGVDEFLYVVSLEPDHLFIVFQGFFSFAPSLAVGRHDLE